jgi:aconitase A
MVDVSGTKDALQKNVDIEFDRNGERYEFLRWGQSPSPISASCRRAPASATR